MPYSDTSGKTGLLQDCEFWTGLGDAGISGNATLKAVFTRLLNVRYAQTLARLQLLSGVDGAEDRNYADHQFSTFTITSGVNNYEFLTDEDGNTISDITGVHVKMTGDTEYTPLDKLTLSKADAQLIMSPPNTTDTGTPSGYIEKGNIVVFDILPDDSGTGKLFYRLVPSYFTTADTTKKPGFVEAGHRVLSLGASLDWLSVFKGEDVALIQRAERELARVDALLDDYTRQMHPTNNRMTAAVHSTR